MFKITYQKCVLFALLVVTTLCISGCREKDNKKKIQIDHQTYIILENTIYATEVHILKSSVTGPKVAVVGGIHGDELAGWKAALKFIERDDFKGELLVIPRANYLGTTLEQRYPGASTDGVYEEIEYSDLNRTFPGRLDGTITEKIAYEIIEQIKIFEPEYIVDLHESRRSYADSSPLVGDQVIFTNDKSCLLAVDLVEQFNQKHLKESETIFGFSSPAVKDTFNDYCSNNFDAVVFTFETNRQLELSRRIEQQLDLLDTLLNLIWN